MAKKGSSSCGTCRPRLRLPVTRNDSLAFSLATAGWAASVAVEALSAASISLRAVCVTASCWKPLFAAPLRAGPAGLAEAEGLGGVAARSSLRSKSSETGCAPMNTSRLCLAKPKISTSNVQGPEARSSKTK